MKRNIVTRPTTYQVEGARNASLAREIKDLRSAVEAGTTGTPPSAPQICAGGFVVPGAFERLRKRLRMTFCVEVPTGTVEIKTVLIAVASIVDAASYSAGANRLKAGYDIEDDRTHVEYKFPESLEYETDYRLIRLVAKNSNGDASFFPSTEQAWNAVVPPAMLFTTPSMFGVPSSPSLSLITINRLDPMTLDVYDAEIERLVYAPLTDAGLAQTWGAAKVDQVHALLRLDGVTIDPSPHILTDEELTQVADGIAGRPLSSPANRGFIRIRNEGLTPGREYTWPKNIAYVNGERKVSTGPAVVFIAGGFSTDPATLTALSLVITQTEPNTSNLAAVDVLFTQPLTPVALRQVRLRRKIQGASDSTYVIVVPKTGIRTDEFNTPGAKIFRLIESLNFRPKKTYTLECTFFAMGGGTRIFTQDVTTGASGVVEPPDIIGTGVPVLTMGLSASSTSPASPAVANDTTHFSIDTADTVNYQTLLTAGIILHLNIPSLAAANQVRKATAFDSANKRFTVDVAFGSTPGNSLAYEIHFGAVIGGKSGTGHGVSSFILDRTIDANVSTVNDFYKGMSLYVPSAAVGEQVQRITTSAYAANIHTLTLEPAAAHAAFAGAPVNNSAYMISQGSFGYQNSDQTGIISPAPLRVWKDADRSLNVVEIIPPIDFNLSKSYCESKKRSNGKIRFQQSGEPDQRYEVGLPGAFVHMIHVRWRNLYRLSGSDGWSAFSSYVAGYQSGDTPTVYEPSDFTPVEVDPQSVYPTRWL